MAFAWKTGVKVILTSYSSDMDTDASSNAAAAFFAIFAAAYVAFILIMIVFFILYWVAMSWSFMVLFRKVGIEPWAAWVPVYNLWKMLELGGFPGWVALVALLPFGGIVRDVFFYIGTYRTGIAFGKEAWWVLIPIFVLPVWGFLLGRSGEVYRPETFAERGWKGPYTGHGRRPMVGAGF
jgi:hypothetical protein